MANNQNQTLNYRQIESDFKKAKIAKPPRNRSKEVDIFLYQTNKTTEELESATGPILVESKFNKNVKFQSTAPLPFDISKPKFASVSQTEIWGSQINGFIYEDVNINPDTYNYITFNLEIQGNMVSSTKYRIVNIVKYTDNKNNFIYAEINAVVESVKTIKQLKSINWQLVQEFKTDVKTKYLKIEFPFNTVFLSNGLKITTLPEKGERPRNDGYTVNHSPQLTLKFIKVRQLGPIEIDDLTLSDLNERQVDDYVGNGQTLTAYISSNSVSNGDFSVQPIISPEKMAVGKGESRFYKQVEQKEYFSKGLKISNEITYYTLEEHKLSSQEVKNFLSGTLDVDSILLENPQNVSVESAIKKITDLNKDNQTDKLYFVVTKISNLTKYLNVEKGKVNVSDSLPIFYQNIVKQKDFPKTRLLREEEFGINFLDNEPIPIELELQEEGFSPLIEIDSLIARNVKITQYDKDHNVIGFPELKFETEFAFNDSKKKTSIQL